MQKNILPGLRMTFWAHLVVGLIFGLGYLLIPDTAAGMLGVKLPDLTPWRVIGAAILGFTATSWFALRETEWERVKLIVEGELVWTVLGTLAMIVGMFTSAYPPTFWLSPIILACFAVAFGYFYMQQNALKTAMVAH